MNEIPVRRIDQTPAPERFARGWHCLGQSKEFTDSPKRIEAFDSKLVVFRDSKGEAIAIQAACPHMGGDLSLGRVDGDMVRKYITYKLKYSIKDREKNSQLISDLCKFLEKQGFLVICSILSIVNSS